MPSLTSELLVRLLDGVTKPAAAMGRAIRGIGDAQEAVNSRAPLGQRLADASAANSQKLDQMRGQMVDAVGAAYLLKNAIAAPIEAAMGFESAMADVRKVVDFDTPESFKKFGDEVINMSRRIPLAAQGLAEIVAAAGQAGIAGNELTDFTERAAKIGVAFDISAGSAGESMAKLRTGLALSNDQVFSLADAMNHLSNAQASSAADILDVVRRVGAQSKMFGFSAEQTSAFASAMLSAGAESEVAATSFRNMGLALTKGGEATKTQRGAFKELGLDSVKVAKDMQQNAVGTTLDVMKRLAKLPKYLQAQVSSSLFGNEARALGPLLTNIELLEQSLGMVAEQSLYAGSAQKEFEARAKTTANSLQLFKNNVSALSITIGNALLPAMNMMMQAFTPAITSISDFSAAHPVLTRNAIMLTSAMVGLRIATIGARWAFLFAKGGLLSFSAGLVALGTSLKTAVTSMAIFRGAATALRVALISTGIGAALVAIGAAGVFIYENWKGIGKMFESFGQSFMDALGPAKAVLDPVINGVSTLYNWITALTGEIDPSGDRWTAWGNAMGSAMGTATANVVSKGRELVAFIKTIPEQLAALNWSTVGSDALAWIQEIPQRVMAIDWGSVASSITSGVAGAFSSIGLALPADLFTSLQSRISSGFASIDLTGAAAAISGKVSGLFASIGEMLSSFSVGGAGDVFASLRAALVSSFSEALAFPMNMMVGIQTRIEQALSGIDFSAAGSAMAAKVSTLFSAITDALSSFTVGEGSLFTSLKGAIVSSLTSALTFPIDIGKAFRDRVYQALGAVDLSSAASVIGEKISGMFTAISSMLSSFSIGGSNAFSGLRTAVFSALKAALSFPAELVTEFQAKIAASLASIDWGSVGAALSSGMSGLLDALKGFYQNMDWSSIGRTIGTMIREGVLSLVDIGQALVDAWNGRGGGSGVAMAVGTAIRDAVVGFDWMGVGASVIGLIGSGLSAAGSMLKGVIEGLFNVDLGAVARTTVQSFIDGCKSMIATFGAWVKSQLANAFSISFQRPSWLGGSAPAAPAPANDSPGAPAPAAAPADAPAAANTNTPLEKRARGGVVKKGNHYVVGDGGEPEYFSPGQNGYITPFSKTEGMTPENMKRPEPKQQRPAASITFAPKIEIGQVNGVADLDARLQEFSDKMERDFQALVAGNFSDAGAA